MTLGFTESKVKSNLCFKVEGRRPVMILLCVDALYFLGMEVWKNADGIFFGQRKYTVEILKRFRMMECMTTPMALNLKLLSVYSLELVDAMMYHQMIYSLMYLTNTRIDICFAVNTLIQFLTNCCKAYFEVSKGYS